MKPLAQMTIKEESTIEWAINQADLTTVEADGFEFICEVEDKRMGDDEFGELYHDLADDSKDDPSIDYFMFKMLDDGVTCMFWDSRL